VCSVFAAFSSVLQRVAVLSSDYLTKFPGIQVCFRVLVRVCVCCNAFPCVAKQSHILK